MRVSIDFTVPNGQLDTEELHWYERLGRALSLYQPPEYINLWHAGADASFHADIEAPMPLIVREAEPAYLSFSDPGDAGSDFAEPGDSGRANSQAGSVRPDQLVETSGSLAHVYITGRRPLAVELAVRFAPARGGLVSSAFCAALLISAFVTIAYEWRSWFSQPANIDATVAVLILAPALIGYLVVRPFDHPVARRHLVGIQILSLVAAVIPLAMAVLLLRYEDDLAALTDTWCRLVYVSWTTTALLLIGLLRAGRRRSKKRQSAH